MDAVSRYLNDFLTPRLRGYGASEKFLLHTIDIIRAHVGGSRDGGWALL